MERRFWVYILSDEPYGTLYIGFTSSLPHRVYQHREGLLDGHTKKHGIKKLVYYEEYPTAEEGIMREKKLKKWKRDWKIELIKKFNPTWRDLYDDLNS